MSIKEIKQPRHRLVRTKLETSNDFNDSLKVINEAIESCRQAGCSGILIDLTACHHTISFADICRVINRITRVNKDRNHRYAFVVGRHSRQIEIAQLLEFCLTQDNIPVQYFFDVNTASRWLEYGFNARAKLHPVSA